MKQLLSFLLLFIASVGLVDAQCTFTGTTFSAIDISGTGTTVFTNQDDVATSVFLTYSFMLYGQTYSSLHVASNGFLEFAGNGSASDTSNDCPVGGYGVGAADPNGVRIVPLHNDLVTTAYHQSFASSPITNPFGGSSSNVEVFQWTGSHLESGFPAVDFAVILYSDGTILFSFTNDANGGANSTTGVGIGTLNPAYGNYSTCTYNCNTASGILDNTAVYLTSNQLPVELTYFEGSNTGEDIVLKWATATESNNEGFEIQRSYDGSGWKTIGFVRGVGTTQETTQHYSFIDQQPLVGINYYRLKQIDFDGRFEYHKVISIEIESSDSDVILFPNPVTSDMNVYLPSTWEGNSSIEIIDISGRIIKQDVIIGVTHNLDVSKLGNGYYVMRIINNRNVSTKYFVKRN